MKLNLKPGSRTSRTGKLMRMRNHASFVWSDHTMPRLPGWAWLLLAIGFATLATYMAMGYLKRQAAVQSPIKAKTSLVVVAKSAIDPASLVSDVQLKTEVWHQEKP